MEQKEEPKYFDKPLRFRISCQRQWQSADGKVHWNECIFKDATRFTLYGGRGKNLGVYGTYSSRAELEEALEYWAGFNEATANAVHKACRKAHLF